MKKLFILTVLMMTVCSVQAQFEITNSGIIKIGNNSPSVGVMNIRSDSTNIYANRTGTSTGFAPVLDGVCTITSPQWGVGIRGGAYSTNGAINCGVLGVASNTTSNKVYGVFGCINSYRGAAIYGQAYPWTSSSGAALTSPYAGYFDGNVHIQGNLHYTGTLLTATPNPSGIQTESLSTASKGTNATSNRLQAIDVQSFYHTAPLLKKWPTMTDQDMASMDSIEVEAIRKSLVDDDVHDVIADQIYAKRHYAIDADQLEEVFPDLVYENENGTKSINYVEMVPILVQAINELKSELDELKGNGEVKKAQTRATNTEEMGENLVMLSLGQNKPNPFGTTTSIEVSVPDEVQKTFIYIYDLQGKKVSQIDINARGKQTVQFNAAALTDGMYLYSLIADGKVVETRRMIVEK